MEVNYKNLEGIIVKVSKLPDCEINDLQLSIDVERDYFYSTMDDMVHKATAWTEEYYYDENGRTHPHEQVYKVLATSDKSKYPEISLMDQSEFDKAINSLLAKR